MPYYNLRERTGSANLTDFEVYYTSDSSKGYRLEYHFRVNFQAVYYFAKTLGNKADEFIDDLAKLDDDFYDIMFSKLEKGEIRPYYSKADCEGFKPPYENDKKKVYDIFLPMQKEFANKWHLYINCD